MDQEPQETPIGGPKPFEAGGGKGKAPIRRARSVGGSYTESNSETRAMEARFERLEGMIAQMAHSGGGAGFTIQVPGDTQPSTSGMDQSQQAGQPSLGASQSQQGGQPPFGASQGQQGGQPPFGASQSQVYAGVPQGAAIQPGAVISLVQPEKKKRKRDKSCTKGYSDTDSDNDDHKWELEGAHETADRHEAMRLATMAATPNVKAKAIREHQRSMIKPIKSIEEMLKLLKLCDFEGKRETIRRGREAHKAAQDRWDELLIAEEHGFDVVERYRQQKATGKQKALAAALDKSKTKKSYGYGTGYGSGYKKSGGGGGGSSSSSRRSPRRSPSPRRARARSPYRSPTRSGASGGGFSSSSFRSGPRKSFGGTCNFCNRPGHYWRECPDRG